MTKLMIYAAVGNGLVEITFNRDAKTPSAAEYEPTDGGRDKLSVDMREMLRRANATSVSLLHSSSVDHAGDYKVNIDVHAWLRAAIEAVMKPAEEAPSAVGADEQIKADLHSISEGLGAIVAGSEAHDALGRLQTLLDRPTFSAAEVEFLLGLIPESLHETPPDSKDTNPMFYVTGTREGDLDLHGRVIAIKRKLG